MKIFVAGASGATGKLLVEQLLDAGHQVRVVVRDANKLPEIIINHENLSVTEASLLDLDNNELQKLLDGCDAIASCLGHNLTMKGIFGQPRKLVTDATKRLCVAIKTSNGKNPVKFVLMNTAGNHNSGIDNPLMLKEQVVFSLIRLLIPPHNDNEKAAKYLKLEIGKNDESIKWVVVRPDSLIDDSEVSEYKVHSSPIRSTIFNAGKTSRVNVAHFMAELMTNSNAWRKWEGQMPVIYNQE